MQRYLWMQVTADEFELPLVVEESASALARKIGSTKVKVIDSCRKKCVNRKSKTRIVKVADDDQTGVTQI